MVTKPRSKLLHDGDPDVIKAALKEALKEWMDEKFADIGKWSARGIVAAVLGLVVYGVMILQGWHPK